MYLVYENQWKYLVVTRQFLIVLWFTALSEMSPMYGRTHHNPLNASTCSVGYNLCLIRFG